MVDMLRSLPTRAYLALASARDREEGQAMVEYAAILGLVAATLVLVFSSLGATTLHLFDEVVSQWP